MKIAFIVDPIEKLKAYKDSSVAMMRAAASRGHEVFTIGREVLRLRDGAVRALAQRLAVSGDDHAWYEVLGEHDMSLAEFDAVLMLSLIHI